MLELPRRAEEIAVHVDGDYPDLVWYLRPLTDAQFQAINLTAQDYTALDGQAMVRWDLVAPAQEILSANHLRFPAALVDGQPFDGRDPQHLARLLPQWRVRAMSALWREARGMDLTLGNSTRQDASSPGEETPSLG